MRTFVDSNIWLYAKLDGAELVKSTRARECLQRIEYIVVSSQVVVEVGSNLVRKGRLPEQRVLVHLNDIMDASELVLLDREMIITASHLRITSTYSYWDSLIIAAALESGCTELWSEDLQHGRVVEGRLRIVNPLLPTA